MTIEEKIFALLELPEWKWCATWFRTGEIIMATPKRATATREAHKMACPDDVIALGCTGETIHGKAAWIGWDLDVGHGAKQFGSTEIAISAGRKIKRKAGPRTEIRLSKSGVGVHVRHLLDKDDMPMKDAIQYAKDIAEKAMVTRMDPTSISRQAHWLWASNPGVNGFQLVEDWK